MKITISQKNAFGNFLVSRNYLVYKQEKKTYFVKIYFCTFLLYFFHNLRITRILKNHSLLPIIFTILLSTGIPKVEIIDNKFLKIMLTKKKKNYYK